MWKSICVSFYVYTRGESGEWKTLKNKHVQLQHARALVYFKKGRWFGFDYLRDSTFLISSFSLCTAAAAHTRALAERKEALLVMRVYVSVCVYCCGACDGRQLHHGWPTFRAPLLKVLRKKCKLCAGLSESIICKNESLRGPPLVPFHYMFRALHLRFVQARASVFRLTGDGQCEWIEFFSAAAYAARISFSFRDDLSTQQTKNIAIGCSWARLIFEDCCWGGDINKKQSSCTFSSP